MGSVCVILGSDFTVWGFLLYVLTMRRLGAAAVEAGAGGVIGAGAGSFGCWGGGCGGNLGCLGVGGAGGGIKRAAKRFGSAIGGGAVEATANLQANEKTKMLMNMELLMMQRTQKRLDSSRDAVLKEKANQ